MTTYIGVIHNDPKSDFGVSFPDFPGCISAGNTLDEAKAMGTEALQGHAKFMIDRGEALPQPSGLAAIMAHADNAAGVTFTVNIQVF